MIIGSAEEMAKELRVLFLTRKWPPAVGGMETYSKELSDELSSWPGIDLAVRALPGRTDGRPPGPFAVAWYFVSNAWFLFRFARAFDVVHLGDMAQIGLGWICGKRSPATRRVVALHGLDVIYGRRNGLLSRIYRAYLGWARRRVCADLFLANSRNTASLLQEEGFNPSVVIPLGVRLPPLESLPAVEKIGDPPTVLFFGRIFHRKGPRWFADNVLPLLPDDVRLMIVGTVWDEEEGAALRSNPRVDMPGAFPVDMSVEAFGGLKRRAAVIVMPNTRNPDGKDVEGFGLTALEAADNGAPLLAAGQEGIRDAVVDGETGFLLPPEDADQWAAKIVELLAWSADQRQQFSHHSGVILRRDYSWKRVASDTVDAYRQAGNGR